jgi:DNA-binding transcriptional ArsR family regulator
LTHSLINAWLNYVASHPTDRLSAIFAALADPTRRAILARLVDGEATVTTLAAPFAISLPAISRHLKVLEAAGLISRSRSAQWRSSRLAPDGLREVVDWVEPYRQFWDVRFDRLDAHLARQLATPASTRRGAPQKGTTP